MGRYKAFFFLVLISYFLSPHSFAQNCDQTYLETEKKNAQNARMSPSNVALTINNLRKELMLIDLQIKKDPTLSNYLQNCRQEKIDTVRNHSKFANEATRENPEFNKALGEYFFYRKQYKDAKELFDKASREEENNFYSLHRAYQAYSLAWNRETYNISEFEQIPRQVEFTREALQRLNRIIEHPDADPVNLVDALQSRALIYHNEEMSEKERQDWERVLRLNPKHQVALEELAKYYTKFKMYNEAINTLKNLVSSDSLTPVTYELLLKSFLELDKNTELLLYSRKATEKFPKELNFKAYYARALFNSNRLKESEEENTALLNQDPKNPLAIQTSALILEKKADIWLKEETKFAYALDAYNQALQLYPRQSLKEKMARVLYEYRKGLKFQPLEATKIDLTQAIDLLDEYINEKNISEETLSLYINSAYPAQEYSKGEKACQKYFDLYEVGYTPLTLENCLSLYKISNNVDGYNKLAKLKGHQREISSEPKLKAKP